MRQITEDELALMNHIVRWGSDGYPIQKVKSRWQWTQWRSVKGAPVVYKTKREATAAFEAFHNMLIDAYGEQRQREYLAEHRA